MNKKFDIIVFNDVNICLEVNFDKENDTVWLSQKQMSDFFDVTTDNISLHIKKNYFFRGIRGINYQGILGCSTSAENAQVRLEGHCEVKGWSRIMQFHPLLHLVNKN